jgi:hypothetical protein
VEIPEFRHQHYLREGISSVTTPVALFIDTDVSGDGIIPQVRSQATLLSVESCQRSEEAKCLVISRFAP